MDKRTCPQCGKDFAPTAPGQKYCPPTQRNRAGKGQARSKCARRASNAQQRGAPATFTVDGPFDCDLCGKRCTPGEDVPAHASRFCCKQHKATWHHIHSDGQRTQEQREDERRQRYIDRLLTVRTSDVGAYRKALRSDPCAYCGNASEALDHIDPKSSGGQDDWTNRTSSCHSCNSLKGSLPLLTALPWIPVATEYHVMRRDLYAA